MFIFLFHLSYILSTEPNDSALSTEPGDTIPSTQSHDSALSIQLHNIVYRGFFYNSWLKDDAPTSYEEHLSIDSLNTQRFYLYTHYQIYNATTKMNNIPINAEMTHRLICEYINILKKNITFFDIHLLPSLTAYIIPEIMDKFYNTYVLHCNAAYDMVDYVLTLEINNITMNFNPFTIIFEISTYLNTNEFNLRIVLLYSFITLHKNLQTHRQIHCPNTPYTTIPINPPTNKIFIKDDNSIKTCKNEDSCIKKCRNEDSCIKTCRDEDNRIKKVRMRRTLKLFKLQMQQIKCNICHKIITEEEYIFSFLCKHKAHLVCFKKIFLTRNTEQCFTCGKSFWNRN
ncbi:hypothetical protein SLOPH_1085 [Spraguea lophii 42_110]|uniref:RING-type domain-containing protein n=1 Tax=Spraguea lophii (strain 42_110) TaxID=1358809 RepID=S7XHS1_SPRLO|nr:hypothetical protein SLOPH_1085 [Spraguea lophii 42_110]